MSEIDIASFDAHKNCEVGDTIIAEDEDGNEYRGTVVRNPGATVYVQSNTGEMLEFRRMKDSGTGERAILLGIDGKGVEDHPTKKGLNKYGDEVTHESFTLSFDYIIQDFQAEHQQHTIG